MGRARRPGLFCSGRAPARVEAASRRFVPAPARQDATSALAPVSAPAGPESLRRLPALNLWCRDSRRRVFGDSAQTGAFLGGTVNAVGCSARAKRTCPWAPVQETVNGAAPMVSGKMRERRREWCMAVPWWLGYSMCWTPSASMRAATAGSLSRPLGFG
jgi:hypothetical protein